jgi:hypothetical protein
MGLFWHPIEVQKQAQATFFLCNIWRAKTKIQGKTYASEQAN